MSWSHLALAIGFTVVLCIIGVLWWLYQRLKKRPKPKPPQPPPG